MGCGGSKDTEESARSADIDKFLEEEKVKFNNEVKLLLLGSGESGKSTVAKQMKIIYLNGFTEEELLSFKPSVYSDLVLCMRSILKAANDFGYEINSVVNTRNSYQKITLKNDKNHLKKHFFSHHHQNPFKIYFSCSHHFTMANLTHKLIT